MINRVGDIIRITNIGLKERILNSEIFIPCVRVDLIIESLNDDYIITKIDPCDVNINKELLFAKSVLNKSVMYLVEGDYTNVTRLYKIKKMMGNGN